MMDRKFPTYKSQCVCCKSEKEIIYRNGFRDGKNTFQNKINKDIKDLLDQAHKTHTPLFGEIGLEMALRIINKDPWEDWGDSND